MFAEKQQEKKTIRVNSNLLLSGVFSLFLLCVGLVLGIVQLNSLIDNKIYYFQSLIDQKTEDLEQLYSKKISEFKKRDSDIKLIIKNEKYTLTKGDFPILDYQLQIKNENTFIKVSGVLYYAEEKDGNLSLWKLKANFFTLTSHNKQQFKTIFNDKKALLFSNLPKASDYILRNKLIISNGSLGDLSEHVIVRDVWFEPSINIAGRIPNSNLYYWESIPKEVFYKGFHSYFKKYFMILAMCFIGCLSLSYFLLIGIKNSKRFKVV